MSQAIRINEIETSGARAEFLRLRRLARLPDGGEITLKAEIEQLCHALGIKPEASWTKERMVFELVQEYHYDSDRTWEEQLERRREYGGGRSYEYIQSREAASLADALESKR